MGRPRIWYVGHPVRPVGGETINSNLDSAEAFKRALQHRYQSDVFLAEYVEWIRTGIDDDAIPELRERGLERSCLVARRCDGIVLCGPRVSSGMVRELLTTNEPAPMVQRIRDLRSLALDYDMHALSRFVRVRIDVAINRLVVLADVVAWAADEVVEAVRSYAGARSCDVIACGGIR
jgi:hypothetical protein